MPANTRVFKTAAQAERAWRRAQRKADELRYQFDSLRQLEADLAAERDREDAKTWAQAMFGSPAK
jgi:hypothetical protein